MSFPGKLFVYSTLKSNDEIKHDSFRLIRKETEIHFLAPTLLQQLKKKKKKVTAKLEFLSSAAREAIPTPLIEDRLKPLGTIL